MQEITLKKKSKPTDDGKGQPNRNDDVPSGGMKNSTNDDPSPITTISTANPVPSHTATASTGFQDMASTQSTSKSVHGDGNIGSAIHTQPLEPVGTDDGFITHSKPVVRASGAHGVGSAQRSGDGDTYNTSSQNSFGSNAPGAGGGGNTPARDGYFGSNDYWGANDYPAADDPFETNRRRHLTPRERVKVTERLYMEVLGRKPSSRDIGYYKYSNLTEDEIRTELLEGSEHRKLIEAGHKYKDIEKRAEAAETRIKMLESKLSDHSAEYEALTEILEAKNKEITIMREKLQSPFIQGQPQSTDGTHQYTLTRDQRGTADTRKKVAQTTKPQSGFRTPDQQSKPQEKSLSSEPVKEYARKNPVSFWKAVSLLVKDLLSHE